ncbi:MAG: phosphoenolpyruvate carboxykinase (ATP) [Candidatus Nanohaloarchaea archaeon]|nr:phosphoenolpyruvate carboxykinase (ATP) [Candidatus Nanohaloarchaea archaeon]
MGKKDREVEDIRGKFPDPEDSNVVYNPSEEELRRFSSDLERTTEYGSPSYVSDYRSRESDKTRNSIDHGLSDENLENMDMALEIAGSREMVCIDRKVGRGSENTYVGRYFVPKEYARIALSLSNLVETAEGEPDFYTLQLPDWEKGTEIDVDVETGSTAVLGSDYTGEAKKSFLRLFMRRAKEKGGLGLHAGSKRVMIEKDEGIEEVGQVYMGLSGTGKTTLTGHGLWLEEPENAEMLQDDVCALMPDGSVHGSEGRGMYIKTLGLDPEEQPELYRAATSGDAVLENVKVGKDGEVDFHDDSISRNGRAAVLREDVGAADDINLDSVDQFFFITRNPLMPPVSKLSYDQAAVAFMLGESIESGAGDPDSIGEPVRVVGFNPFIIGSEGEEGNRFPDLMEETDAEAYMLNTGTIGGDDGRDIGVGETIEIIRNITRGDVDWEEDEKLGFSVPERIGDMYIEDLDPRIHVDDFERKIEELREEREEYLKNFDDLDSSIVDACY